MNTPGVHYPHRIRLRGPWDCEPLQPAQPMRRIVMPTQWRNAGLSGFSGEVRCIRRFGYPGRIDSEERVWLTFTDIQDRARVTLNDHQLGAHQGPGGCEYDITSLLKTRNELVVDVTSLDDSGGLTGEVSLEIRRTAFIRHVALVPLGEGESQRLRLTGMVVGNAPRPLDWYVLRDNASVAYGTCQPTLGGVPIDVLLPVSASPAKVRLELIDAATVWYALEVESAPDL